MIQEMPTPCDFSSTALIEAANMLGTINLPNLRVYVGRQNALNARCLQGDYGFELTIIPDHLLKTPHTWGAEWNGHQVWSPST